MTNFSGMKFERSLMLEGTGWVAFNDHNEVVAVGAGSLPTREKHAGITKLVVGPAVYDDLVAGFSTAVTSGKDVS